MRDNLVKDAEQLYDKLLTPVLNDREKCIDRIIGFLSAYEEKIQKHGDKYDSRGFPSSMWDK